MRHKRIAKSNRHKKFKSVNNLIEDDFRDSKITQKNLSEQTVSNKWKQILDLKQKFIQKSKQKKKKNKNKNDLICVRPESEPIEKGMTRSDRPLPDVIEQGLYESHYQFMSRLSKLSAKAKAEATIEDRFDVDFNQTVDTNDDKIDVKSKTDEKKSNKQLKQKLKKIKKKQKKKVKKEKDDSFAHLRDEIRFGERVDEPPTLGAFKLRNKSKINKKN